MIEILGKRIHFIGVGGMGMSALALFSADMGATVSGSDRHPNAMCKVLQNKGAAIWKGENADLMKNADIVVFSSAIKDDNTELAYAREVGIKTYERFEFLGEIASGFGKVVAVSGTHGKTTTTAMITHILMQEKKRFVAMIGGECVDFGNYVNNTMGKSLGECIFVCEACEYKRSLLALNPDVGAITNIECDHPDCYKNLQSVKDVFAQFVAQSKVCFLNANDGDLIFDSSGGSKDNFVCRNVFNVEGGDTFSVFEKTPTDIAVRAFEKRGGKWTVDNQPLLLKDGGEYNANNAAFAVCICEMFGISADKSVKALSTFSGVKRRFERAKDICGVPTYFDFAHHPTEIRRLIERTKVFGKQLVVFQPHTYSRTKAYLNDFVRALSDADTLVIMPTYAARESASMGVTSKDLATAIFDKNCKQTVYIAKNDKSTLDYVKKHAKEHGIVLFVGAGTVYDLKDKWE